jgi:hypothetical protein
MRPSRSSTRLAVLAFPESLRCIPYLVWLSGAPGWLIRRRSGWAPLLTRPFTHGRGIGGELDSHDQFQHLFSRAAGVMFVIGGTSLIVEGLRGPN